VIQSLYLGRVAYGEALRLQEELVELRRADRIDRIADTLLLVEHPPVLTLGRNARRANILASDELLRRRGITLHEINRGGDVTYHGPGQLVGYPIFDLRTLPRPEGGRMGPVDFVRRMEEALIRLCAHYGVPAGRIPGLTGVWCGGAESGPAGAGSQETRRTAMGAESTATAGTESLRSRKKIAAIGIHVSRGITSHGFAFNVTTDLRDFQLINPCGITDKPVTSLEREAADAAQLPGLEAIAHQAARQFGLVFNQQILAAESLDPLRARAAASREFPAEDTPLQVPREVERLHTAEDKPVRA
jgi:lipoyl(octanoyl) transferase